MVTFFQGVDQSFKTIHVHKFFMVAQLYTGLHTCMFVLWTWWRCKNHSLKHLSSLGVYTLVTQKYYNNRLLAQCRCTFTSLIWLPFCDWKCEQRDWRQKWWKWWKHNLRRCVWRNGSWVLYNTTGSSILLKKKFRTNATLKSFPPGATTAHLTSLYLHHARF